MKKLKDENKLAEVIKRYDNTQEGNMWQELVELEAKVEEPDIIIPILGTQGMGKSTLINAFLGEDIMPSEADETTCIPVEIRYGENSVSVYHKDGTVTSAACNKNELAQYVDNAYNPANEKGISHIVINKEYSVLQNGTVLVDLPGVGSLTKENEQTTRKYIENLCAAVFIVTTSPPITESQARFIKAVWRGVSTAFVIQNVWDGDSRQEVEDGLEYNKNVISSITREIGTDNKANIIPVNAYLAAKGRFISDEALIKKSNILQFVKEIDGFAENYTNIVRENFVNRIKGTIAIIESEIESRINQSKMSKEELLESLREERKNFNDKSEEIDRIVSEIQTKLSQDKKEGKTFAETLAKKKAELLRSELYHLIESGVVDGDQLTEAFTDYQNEYGTAASDEAYEELVRVSEELSEMFEDLKTVVDKEKVESAGADKFYKEQKLKWEKGVELGFDLAGSVGGWILGDIVAGAIGGSWGGPVGIAVGIAVAVIGGLIGNGIKKAKRNQRADETKQQISPYIKDFEKRIREAVNTSFKNYFDDISAVLDDFIQSRESHLDAINGRISSIMQSGNDISASIEAMDADLGFLKTWEA